MCWAMLLLTFPLKQVFSFVLLRRKWETQMSLAGDIMYNCGTTRPQKTKECNVLRYAVMHKGHLESAALGQIE